jgi:hypothetical protein
VTTIQSFERSVVAFLQDAVEPRDEISRFLDPQQPSWAKFDSELGYVPNDCEVPDGIDGSVSTYRYGSFGERMTINYADRPVRINTYGDSMTQCHQVSDGETWQEQLAAHFGEPIRNFGVGGYGVFHAVSRLRRSEASPRVSGPYLVLNIFLDDHYRSIEPYRLLRLGKWHRNYQDIRTSMFHANPWSYVRLDPSSGELVRRPNPCPTEASLYNLCDKEFLVDTFRNDMVVQLVVGFATRNFCFLPAYAEMAEMLGVPLDLDDEDIALHSARAFYDAYAFRSTVLLLLELRDYLAQEQKHGLVLLSYGAGTVASVCAGARRPDARFLGTLDDCGLPYVDALAAHVSDFRSFTVSPVDYAARYFSGHYTPMGNHFFAFAVKDAVVTWLRPPPPAYAGRAQSMAAQAARLAEQQ